jgi:hypothetical protein
MGHDYSSTIVPLVSSVGKALKPPPDKNIAQSEDLRPVVDMADDDDISFMLDSLPRTEGTKKQKRLAGLGTARLHERRFSDCKARATQQILGGTVEGDPGKEPHARGPDKALQDRLQQRRIDGPSLKVEDDLRTFQDILRFFGDADQLIVDLLSGQSLGDDETEVRPIALEDDLFFR